MDAEILKAVVLGFVQGLTEFLPVSSTAHLILIPRFFGWSGALDSLTFDIALHAGTLFALLLCFYRDWVRLFLEDRRMLLALIVGTIPAGIAGVLLRDYVEHAFRSPLLMAGTLSVFAVLMLMAERYGRKGRDLSKGSISMFDAVYIGTAQAIALIPGVSRSGITITAGLFRGLDREAAARFSFLLSTPVISGAVMLEGLKTLKTPASYETDVFLAGFLAAFASGVLAIRFLLRYLRKHPLDPFAYYRFGLAALVLLVMP